MRSFILASERRATVPAGARGSKRHLSDGVPRGGRLHRAAEVRPGPRRYDNEFPRGAG